MIKHLFSLWETKNLSRLESLSIYSIEFIAIWVLQYFDSRDLDGSGDSNFKFLHFKLLIHLTWFLYFDSGSIQILFSNFYLVQSYTK